MLWPIFTAIVVLSGFYYTTQSRLEQLEAEVQELQRAGVDLSIRADKAGSSVIIHRKVQVSNSRFIPRCSRTRLQTLEEEDH